MSKTIGVLIPTYNRCRLLLKCLDSIFNQTYQDFVIYIYDDGSDDDTLEQVRKIRDSRIVMISNPQNYGVAHARNRLLNMCSQDIACWQDDDDLSNKYRLETQYNVLKDSPDSYVIGNCKIFRDYSEIDIKEKVVSTDKQMGNASAMFWNKNLPVFDEELKTGEDTDWFKKLQYYRIELEQINYYIYYHTNRLGMNKDA